MCTLGIKLKHMNIKNPSEAKCVQRGKLRDKQKLRESGLGRESKFRERLREAERKCDLAAKSPGLSELVASTHLQRIYQKQAVFRTLYYKLETNLHSGRKRQTKTQVKYTACQMVINVIEVGTCLCESPNAVGEF